MNITLKIDTTPTEIPGGSTLLDAAKKAGIQIPTLCYLKDSEPFTSCMVCLVKIKGQKKLVPACSTIAEEGMEVTTIDDEITEARRAALGMLLNEHTGDCEAPCHIVCPAHMNIPLMNRLITKGLFTEALKVVKKDIALPAVLGRICPAPCEKACKRTQIDDAVSICLLKRFVADVDLYSHYPYRPKKAESSGKQVAIIGSGPTGLSAAWYLTLKGHDCKVFEKEKDTGGMLRYGVSKDDLPNDVLDNEISVIKGTGIDIVTGCEVDKNYYNQHIQNKFDAVVIATGENPENADIFNIKPGKTGIDVQKNTFETSVKGVFAGGSAIRPQKMAVRSVGHGKEIAFSVDRFLSGRPVVGEKKLFNSKTGKLKKDDFPAYLVEASTEQAVDKSVYKRQGFNQKTAIYEAQRCLHCDCRKPQSCTLRLYADEYDARQTVQKADKRKKISKEFIDNILVFEPGKCIKCGICVRITQKEHEELGLTFIGRGFQIEISPPFNKKLSEAVKKTAQLCIEHCPTGAISAVENEMRNSE